MNVKVDISKVELETDRLILRPFKMSDVNDFYEYAKVEGVGEAAGWNHHKNKLESQRILKMFINNKNTFAIVFKGNNKVIGSIGLENYNTNLIPEFDLLRGKELGYVLSKDYWGRGIMTEATSEVLEYCFTKGQMEFMCVEHFIGNQKSKRVIEKLGFKYRKLCQTRLQDQSLRDSIFYTMLKCDYDEIKRIQ